MSETHEAPAEVVEDQEVLDDDATPTDPSTDPAPAEDAEAEDQADDDAPTPHEASRGYGVVGKFSTTDRSGDL